MDTGDGWLLNAGDAYFFHGQLDPTRPHRPPGLAAFESLVQTERRCRLDNQQPLRALAAEHGSEVRVFCAHDATEYRRLESSPTRS